MDDIPVAVGLLLVAYLMCSNRHEIVLHSGWIVSAAMLSIIAWKAPAVLTSLGNNNYNFIELFRTDRSFSNFRLALIFMWAPLTVHWAVARFVSGNWMQSVLWMPASTLVGWGILKRSVTVESIQDILGSPIWGLSLDIEYILRFATVYCFFVWIPLFSTVLFLQFKKSILSWIAVVSIMISVSPVIISNFNPGDNITELIQPMGEYFFTGLVLYLILSSFLCRKWWQLVFCVPVLAATLGWILFMRAVEISSIHGVLFEFPLFVTSFTIAVFCIYPTFMGLEMTKINFYFSGRRIN